MASNPLDDIAGQVGAAFANVFSDGTLTIETAAASGGTALDAPAITSKSYACKVLEEEYSSYLRATSQVGMTDVKLLILAASLPANVRPVPGARIKSKGVTRRIVARDTGIEPVSTDPARAVWSCRARGIA